MIMINMNLFITLAQILEQTKLVFIWTLYLFEKLNCYIFAKKYLKEIKCLLFSIMGPIMRVKA